MDMECLGECIPLNFEQSCLWPINLKGPFSAFKKGGEARGWFGGTNARCTLFLRLLGQLLIEGLCFVNEPCEVIIPNNCEIMGVSQGSFHPPLIFYWCIPWAWVQLNEDVLGDKHHGCIHFLSRVYILIVDRVSNVNLTSTFPTSFNRQSLMTIPARVSTSST